jgi:steroid 5-alpha reductase family enzyme
MMLGLQVRFQTDHTSRSTRVSDSISQTIWMSRLSYNTYRRGLFSLSDEDYRWAVLRQRMPPWLFQVLNLTFIGVYYSVKLIEVRRLIFP